MYISAVVAMSLNGFITDGNDPDVTKWTSDEDKTHFKTQKDAHNLIVMGKNTYLAMEKSLAPTPDKLRVVLVGDTTEFDGRKIEGQLEFSSLTPVDLIAQLEQRGYDRMLLAGGSRVYGSFLSLGLINELQVTIEPVVFASGTPIFTDLLTSNKLILTDYKKLNEQGTLLLTYRSSIPPKM